ncbi:MAG: hypothetical protein QOD62_4, partial [Actinomycetota bacterium]|nr:hypothetical protein [Actinomycetota bacterium]
VRWGMLLDDPAPVEDHDPVGEGHDAPGVRHDDCGPASDHPPKSGQHGSFRLGVETGRGLVQQEQ